jgi:hypothetical protein
MNKAFIFFFFFVKKKRKRKKNFFFDLIELKIKGKNNNY